MSPARTSTARSKRSIPSCLREKVPARGAPREPDRTEVNERARKAMTEATAVAIDVGTRIQSLRGLQVLLDSDLAAIYGVTTAALNQAVRRGNLTKDRPGSQQTSAFD